MLYNNGISVVIPRVSNKEKLEKVKALLASISETWREEDVLEYGASMSFDELVAEIHTIHLR